jgi:hypothetical protein
LALFAGSLSPMSFSETGGVRRTEISK